MTVVYCETNKQLNNFESHVHKGGITVLYIEPGGKTEMHNLLSFLINRTWLQCSSYPEYFD